MDYILFLQVEKVLGFSQGTGSPCAIALCYHTKVQSLENAFIYQGRVKSWNCSGTHQKVLFFFFSF